MKLNEIKFIVQKNTPDFVFKIIYKIWIIIIHPILNIKNSYKLKKFKEEVIYNFKHDDIQFKIFINPKNGTLDNEIYLHGVYEPYFLSRIKKELKSGDTFVDIGTNIGQHSLFASYVVGENGKVISFEPIKKLYEQILKNIEINNIKNIEAHNYACGEENEKKIIYKRAENIGGSSLVASEKRNNIEEIDVIKADDVLENEAKIDFIKIDVEGYEYPVLLGAKKTITKFHPKMLIEFSPFFYNMSDKSHNKKIIELLKNFGYTIYDLENNDKKVDENFLNYIEKNKIPQTNLLCIYEK